MYLNTKSRRSFKTITHHSVGRFYTRYSVCCTTHPVLGPHRNVKPWNPILRTREARQLFFRRNVSQGSTKVQFSGRLPEAHEDAHEDGKNQVQAQGHDQNAPYRPRVEARADLSIQSNGRLPRQTLVDFVDGVVSLLHGDGSEQGGSP